MSPFPIWRCVKPALRGLWEQWKHRLCCVCVWEVWIGLHSFSTGNGLSRGEEGGTTKAQCSAILRPDHSADEGSWVMEWCQQYVSRSPEIWDGLKSWIPKWLRTSGGPVCSYPRCLQPPTPSPCSLCQAPSYTFPDWTNVSAETTTNYIKKAAVVTAARTMVASST